MKRPECIALELSGSELRRLYELVDQRCEDLTELMRPQERPPGIYALRERLAHAIGLLRQFQAEYDGAAATQSC